MNDRYAYIEREYVISCAHMLVGYQGNCSRLHGHNYRVLVGVRGGLDEMTGMLLDFAKLDEVVKPVLDKLDHCMLVAGNEWPYLLTIDPSEELSVGQCYGDFYMVGLPTTAENIAFHLRICIFEALMARGLMATENDLVTEYPVKEVKVTVWETPRSSAQSA
jgi:6-pyruvoyl tetrahydropterin synthase/QueD family protein